MLHEVHERLHAVLKEDNPTARIIFYALICNQKQIQGVEYRTEYEQKQALFCMLQKKNKRYHLLAEDFAEKPSILGMIGALYRDLPMYSPQKFFELFAPDYIAQPAAAFKIVNPREFSSPDAAYCILGVKVAEARSDLLNIDMESMERIRAAVEKCLGDKTQALAYAVNGFPLTNKRKEYTAGMKIANVFKQHNLLNIDYIISIYNLVRCKFRGGSGQQESVYMKQIHNNAARLLRSKLGVKYDLLGTDEAINEAADSMMEIQPSDLLEALIITQKNDDSAMEQNVIYSRFFEQCFGRDDRILVINPSPSFIIKMQAEKREMQNTTFAVESDAVAEALEWQFPNARFWAMESLPSVEETFQKILFFSRDMKIDAVNEMLMTIMSLGDETSRIYSVLPSNMVTKKYYIENDLIFWLCDYLVERIDLFPKETFSSEPKMKALVCATLLGDNGQNVLTRTKLVRYALCYYQRHKCYYIQPKESAYVSSNDLNREWTVYNLLQKTLKAEAKTPERVDPKRYEYTPDISFWYRSRKKNISPFDVEAYVCELLSPQRKRTSKFGRGRMVKDSLISVSTLKSQEKLDDWLENIYPFKPKVHSAVKSVFMGSSPDQLSIKTLWYLQYKEGESQACSKRLEMRKLLSAIGNLCYGDEEAIVAAMDKFCGEMDTSEKIKYWMILKTIGANIKEEGYPLTRNIADKPLRELIEKHESVAEVSAALGRSYFSVDEEWKLLDFLKDRVCKAPQYISVLIRFYTGLSPKVIAALTWGDFQKSDLLVPRLCLHAHYDSKSNRVVRFQNDYEYRFVPISITLSEVLERRKNQIEELLGSNRNLDDIQLITTDELLKENKPQWVGPRNISNLSRAVLRENEISHVSALLPNDDNEMVETDLSTSRDLFSANFKHRLNHFCGFIDSERRHMLGLTQQMTLYRNYCDYNNSISQLMLFVKLCRWDVLHHTFKRDPEDKNNGGAEQICKVFVIPISGKVKIKVSSKHGFGLRAELRPKQEGMVET